MTLEELLKMKVKGKDSVNNKEVEYSPEFRVSVQHISENGVHFIIHADGHNSETLDFIATDNEIRPIPQPGYV